MKENVLDSRLGEYLLRAEPFHCDWAGRLTIGYLGNHLLNASGNHASERHFNIEHLINYSWVLSRLVVEIDHMPMQHEQFSVQTWVENVQRLFTSRNYTILDEARQPIGHGRAIWALIDLQTRKPQDLVHFNDGQLLQYLIPEKVSPIDGPGRVKLSVDAPVVYTHKVAYSDIDLNGHLNSVRYIEHLLNTFDMDFHKQYILKRFEIAYSAECYAGEIISIYKEQVGTQKYNLEVRRPDGVVAVKAQLTFIENAVANNDNA